MPPTLRLKYLSALLLSFSLYLHAGLAQSQWQVQKTGIEVSCSVFEPASQTVNHTVVLVHDKSGISDATLAMAEAMVDMGCQVIVPDLKAALSSEQGTRSNWQVAYADRVSELLDAVLLHAVEQEGKHGKLVVVGLGWGGTQAFELAARSRRPELVVVFGGQGPRLAAHCARISAPIYGFYGTAERENFDQVNQLTRYMLASNKLFEPITFSQAEKNFMAQNQHEHYRIPNQNARQEAMARLKVILLNAEERQAMR